MGAEDPLRRDLAETEDPVTSSAEVSASIVQRVSIGVDALCTDVSDRVCRPVCIVIIISTDIREF